MALPNWREAAPVAGTIVFLVVARWIWQHVRYLGPAPARPKHTTTTRYLLPRALGLKLTSALNFGVALPFAAGAVGGVGLAVGELFSSERQRAALFLFMLGGSGLAGLVAFALGGSGLRLWWRSDALRPIEAIDDR